jgi:O-antigen biosynthesis protein
VSRLWRAVQHARRVSQAEGTTALVSRVLGRLAERAAPPGERMPVHRSDVLAAAQVQAKGGHLPPPLPALPGEPLTVAWIMPAPPEGSGGHTTLFRLIGSLEQAGHRCIVYIYDCGSTPLASHEAVVRQWWPWVQAEVRDSGAGIDDAHAVVSTSWDTAYRALASPAKGARLYLVQDLEPQFYPAGAQALLAEATYRFGFHGITAGPWLAATLGERYGMTADSFEFGCDIDRYRLATGPDAPERNGVCFFARSSTPRRAFDLGTLALELFAARHPDVEIHFFGGRPGRLPFSVTDHGVLPPDGLGRLYNRCVAGLVLSATNVSLVPHEMLAAGCIPVVNDADHNRMVLDNDHVTYAAPTPHDLATALSRLVSRSPADIAAGAATASASVAGRSWAEAGAVVEQAIRRAVTAAAARGEAPDGG